MFFFFFFKQKTAYEMRISDWSSYVCSSDLELVIGDRQTGKTSICLDAVLNQKYENSKNKKNALYCIYTAIGQKRSSISKLVTLLEKTNSLEYSIIEIGRASCRERVCQYV